jgi:hypothetical protein
MNTEKYRNHFSINILVLNDLSIRAVAILLIPLLLLVTTLPQYGSPSPPEPDFHSLEQAEALIVDGLAEESLKMLEKLKPEMRTPEQQIKFYLLKIRAFLVMKDKEGAENTVREIYKQDLTGLIEMEDLDEEVKFLIEKVQPEYWFALKDEKQDEEQFDRLVIQQYKKKPKKKKLIPYMILGAILIGTLATAILLIASGSSKEENGEVGTLKFENCNYWDVTVEIFGIVKNAPGTHSNIPYGPSRNFLFIDLPPDIHTLTVTSTTPSGETKVFVYSIEISLGWETHFTFIHL